MIRRILPFFVLLGLFCGAFSAQAEIGNTDRERSVFDSTDLVKAPVEFKSPLSLDNLSRKLETLKAERGVQARRRDEIESKIRKHPRFPELDQLDGLFKKHNDEAKRQRTQCQPILDAGTNRSAIADCNRWAAKIDKNAEALEKKADVLKIIFGKDLDALEAAETQLKTLDLEMEVLEKFKTAGIRDCENEPGERAMHQCMQCLWDGSRCPALLTSPNFKRKVDYLFKHPDQIKVENLRYEDLP